MMISIKWLPSNQTRKSCPPLMPLCTRTQHIFSIRTTGSSIQGTSSPLEWQCRFLSTYNYKLYAIHKRDDTIRSYMPLLSYLRSSLSLDAFASTIPYSDEDRVSLLLRIYQVCMISFCSSCRSLWMRNPLFILWPLLVLWRIIRCQRQQQRRSSDITI